MVHVKDYRKMVIDNFKKISSIKLEKHKNFYLTHTYDTDKNRKEYVIAPYSSDTMYALVAYIQYESAEHDESYSMDQIEIIETLEKFYDCIRSNVPLKPAEEIDLYLNWEYFCGVAEEIQSISHFYRDGLREHLKGYVDKFHESMMAN